jgi:hypothetical protein
VQDPECYDRRSEKKNGTTLKIRRQFPVRIKSCMCYYIVHALYICSNDCVLYISCSAPNNLLEQYYVDTTLANTSGRAANSATAGGSSRKPNVGGRGKWSTSSSPIAHRFSAARPLQPSGLQSSPIAICDRLQESFLLLRRVRMCLLVVSIYLLFYLFYFSVCSGCLLPLLVY